MHLSGLFHIAHRLYAAGNAVIRHIDTVDGRRAFERIAHLLVAERIVIVGFNDLDMPAGKAVLIQSLAKALKPHPMGIEFRIADRNEQAILRTQIFRHQLAGNTTAADQVLTDEDSRSQPVRSVFIVTKTTPFSRSSLILCTIAA